MMPTPTDTQLVLAAMAGAGIVGWTIGILHGMWLEARRQHASRNLARNAQRQKVRDRRKRKANATPAHPPTP